MQLFVTFYTFIIPFPGRVSAPSAGGVALLISHNVSYAKLECEISIHLC